MRIQTKWQRVLLTIGLGGLVYLVLNCLFAYFYYRSGGIHYVGSDRTVTFFDSLYFALVTFLTIGYGDITPVSAAAKGIFFVQVYLGLILPPVFSGLLFYFIIKRPRNVFVSEHIYIRYRKDKFLLSVRVGNRGGRPGQCQGNLRTVSLPGQYPPPHP